MKFSKREAICKGAVGIATGLVNGFFGAGGGMLLVPLLTGVCKLDDKKAFASSIAVILPITLVSVTVYAIQGNLDFSSSLPYLIGGAAGGLLGGLLFKKMPPVLLHKLLGGFILWGGLRLIFR